MEDYKALAIALMDAAFTVVILAIKDYVVRLASKTEIVTLYSYKWQDEAGLRVCYLLY